MKSSKIVVFLLLVSFNFISCTQSQKRKSRADVDRHILRAFCWNADGKGRMLVSGNRHLFTYESGMRESDGELLFGVTIPGRGQEIVSFNYGQGTVQGSFYQRIKKNLGSRDRANLQQFLNDFMKILKNGYCQAGDCVDVVDRSQGFRYVNPEDSKKLKLERPFSENEIFQFDLDPDARFLKISLIDLRRAVPEQKYLSLDLFPGKCTETPHSASN